MTDAIPLAFDLPAVGRKKLTVDFDGGNQSSDGGVLLLRQAEARIGVCRRIAEAMPDRRDPTRVGHTMDDLVKSRAFAIACGHEDAIDLDLLRNDPGFKLALGRCPESGEALASQSTVTRMENAPSKIEAARVTAALVDQFAANIVPGTEAVLDIDDSFYVAHGGQQLAFWNAHHDERGFAPMHIHHVESGAPVVVILRPAKTPKGTEAATVLRHVTKRLRRNASWAGARIIWRGDSHYGRPEAMDWCEDDGSGYVFGLAGNRVLDGLVAETAEHLAFWHALSTAPKTRGYTEVEYQAKSWRRPRRVVARIEVSLQPDGGKGLRQEIDIRYVVTSLAGRPEHIYEAIYCRRGEAENLIKLHKAQVASDRMSCHAATANQIRLVLATAAFWLMREVRCAIPDGHRMARAEFRSIRERLLKIAARIVEMKARIRVHLPASCPERALFRSVALNLRPAEP